MSSITAGMEKNQSLYQPLKKRRYLVSTLADNPTLLKPCGHAKMCVSACVCRYLGYIPVLFECGCVCELNGNLIGI